MTTFKIIGETLTLASFIVYWISRFLKKKNNILFIDIISRIIAILGFYFLHTYDGIKNAVYAIVRNIFGQLTNDKSKKIRTITFLILLIILILIYSFNFNGIGTICVAICGIFNLYGTIMSNEQGIRLYGILGSLFYLAFLFFSQNITGTICETIGIIVKLASYLKYKKNK